ncbi:hypothetical protein SAMN05216570_2538 [Dyella sp. OK004]|uniref:Ig-like domain-containing protein n=1 Tax=Dyella sp. OK004 TaxID=1855292 RepID=UPI0008ED7880|nr:Ig-like domain-containing protein [Dyella sp. OK004]SFS11580.1 hypothetical protein SAMN05216570_2538 [Dyella sp. OK004]
MPDTKIPTILYAYDEAAQVELHSGETAVDRTPILHGGGMPGTVVTIYDGQQRAVGSAQVNTSGEWEFELKADLASSVNLFQVSTDGQAFSELFEIDVDPRVFAPVFIDSVSGRDGSAFEEGGTTDPYPVLTGKVDVASPWLWDMAGDVWVTIYDGSKEIGKFQVTDGSGNWEYQLETALSPGEHHLTAKLGNSPASGAVDFSELPATDVAPSIEIVRDVTGGSQADLSSGDVTDERNPRIQGKGEPGTDVAIYDNGELIGAAHVNSAGNWWFTVWNLLGGDHLLVVKGADDHESAPFKLTVDISGIVPGISIVRDVSGDSPGNLSSGDVTHERNPRIQGTAEPGTDVAIYDNGELIGTAHVNIAGNWWFTAWNLLGGEHNLVVKGADDHESSPFKLTIDNSSIVPEISIVREVTGDSPINLSSGATTDERNPRIQGTAEPGTDVTIYDNGESIGTAHVNSAGNWWFTAWGLGEGKHGLSVTGAHGNESAASFEFIVQTMPATQPAIQGAIAADGSLIGSGYGYTTVDVRPTLFGNKAGANAIVTIMDDGKVIGITHAGAQGTWAYEFSDALLDGTHHITVQVGAGPVSNVFDLGVATWSPKINSVYDHDTDQSHSQGGFVITDAHPTISGIAPISSYVTLMDGDKVLGTVKADAQGNWSITPTLDPGSHHLSVSADNGKNGSSAFDFNTNAAPQEDSQPEELAQHDILVDGHDDLFTSHSEHDNTSLSVHDLEVNQVLPLGGLASQHASTEGQALNIHFPLSHEPIHVPM